MPTYCLDCDKIYYWDAQECPYCGSTNTEILDEDAEDPLAYVEDWEDR